MQISFASLGLALVAAAGCNNLLGQEAALADGDGDGVADAVDNCPFLANPQQRDLDGDGLGDACNCIERGEDHDADGIDDACDDCIGAPIGEDAGGDGIDDGCEVCAAAAGIDADGDGTDDACDDCPLGPLHDEDGDGISDACDACPTQAAEPCDRGVTGGARFDPLVEQDGTLWPGVVAGWSWGGDQLHIAADARRTTLAVLPGAYLVETRGETAGTLRIACVTRNTTTECVRDETTGTLRLGIDGPGGYAGYETVPVPDGPVRFELSADPVAGTSTCAARDASGAVIAIATADDYYGCDHVTIKASLPSTLDYLWILGE